MSRILWKSFHLCFPTNLTKCSSPPCLPSSAAEDPGDPNPNSLLRNFNILYHHSSSTDVPSSFSTTTSLSAAAATSSSSSSSYDSDIAIDSPPPELASVFASRRFFFSSPGPSNAITDSPRELFHDHDNAISTAKKKEEGEEENYESATALTTTTTDSSVSRLLNGGAAVMQHVHSPDPYRDFRRSMQEMIDDAMDGRDAGMAAEAHHEFLHELLLSYLSLNPRDMHDIITRAFADVLVSLFSDARRRC